MALKIIQRALVICFAVLVVSISAWGQDYKSLLGKWNMTAETNGDPVKWTLDLKEDGGKLVAFLATDDGEQPAKDLTYENGVLKFKAPYQGEDYDIELKATGDKLDGTWSGGGDSGKTTGTKG
jgi:hypothetical protein